MADRRSNITIHGSNLNKGAVLAANRELLKNNPHLYDYNRGAIRKLTLSRSDYLYRKEWMDAYYRHLVGNKKKPVACLISEQKWDKILIGININWWANPQKYHFIEAVNQVEKCLEVVETGVSHHKQINKEHWIVSYFSELFGEVNLDYIIQLSKSARGSIRLCRKAYYMPVAEDHHIEVGIKALKEAVKTINQIDKLLVKYRQGVEKGAKTSVMGIEITITVLSTLAGAGAVGLAGKALSNYRKYTIAAEWLKSKPVLNFLASTSAEFVAKTTIETSATLTTLLRSNQKIEWEKILINMRDSFIKDLISGGLSKIFLLKILKPKIDIRFPNTIAFCREFGLEPPLTPRPVTDYITDMVGSMGVETLYQILVIRVSQQKKGKKMTLRELLEAIATEFVKFNFGNFLKKWRLK